MKSKKLIDIIDNQNMDDDDSSLHKVLLPVIRRVIPNLIANDIVGVQPMTAVPIKVMVGQYEQQDGEVYYVVFDEENGDLEFSTLESFEAELKKILKKGDKCIQWVSPNEPLDFDFASWYNGNDGEALAGPKGIGEIFKM